MLFRTAIKEFSKTSETENANASCCEGRFTDPNVVLAVDCAVLWVLLFELLMHLVSLVHHIQVGYLPPAELKDVGVDSSDQTKFVKRFDFLDSVVWSCEGVSNGLVWVNWVVELTVSDDKVQDALVESKSRLIEVFLDKLVPFTTLLLHQQVSRKEDRIPQQYRIQLCYTALRWELAYKASL